MCIAELFVLKEIVDQKFEQQQHAFDLFPPHKIEKLLCANQKLSLQYQERQKDIQ